jgi:hypothetical protein
MSEQNPKPERSDTEIYEKIMSEHGDSTGIAIDTAYGEMDFTVVEPNRSTKNRVQNAIPQGLVEVFDELDVDMEDADPDEIVSEAAEKGVDVTNLSFDEEATEAWDDMLVEVLEHDELVREEIAPLVRNRLPDDVWYGIGGIALKLGNSSGVINGFREK